MPQSWSPRAGGCRQRIPRGFNAAAQKGSRTTDSRPDQEPAVASPVTRLIRSVKWFRDVLTGVALPHLFVLCPDDDSEPQRVKTETYFPGATRILTEFVDSPDGPHPSLQRREFRAGTVVSTITFITLRDAAVNLWPVMARLVPRHHVFVAVTLEGTLIDD